MIATEATAKAAPDGYTLLLTAPNHTINAALQTKLPFDTEKDLVPVAIVGSEEQQPGFANLSGLARLLGMPALPITLGFPWLGPLGLLPMPVKYRIYFGEPISFDGDADEEDAASEERVDAVKREITVMLQRGVAKRSGIFR